MDDMNVGCNSVYHSSNVLCLRGDICHFRHFNQHSSHTLLTPVS